MAQIYRVKHNINYKSKYYRFIIVESVDQLIKFSID